jgi:hypothetical protein
MNKLNYLNRGEYMNVLKKKCPCCGYFTLSKNSMFEICPVCYWEDDPVQLENQNYDGGANDISLIKAKESFIKIGAISEEYTKIVRQPLSDEL